MARVKNIQGEPVIVPELGGLLVDAGEIVEVPDERLEAYTCQVTNWVDADLATDPPAPALPERTWDPADGVPLPELPESAYGPEAVALPAAEDAVEGVDGPELLEPDPDAPVIPAGALGEDDAQGDVDVDLEGSEL